MKHKIYLGTDHAGFKLKEQVKNWLVKEGYEIVDNGDLVYQSEDDYPDFIFPAAKAVSRDPKAKGIIFGYSGQGEAMAANRVKGIRATAYYSKSNKILKLSREHNDANILSIGAGFITFLQAKSAIKLWLKTPFSKITRHKRRIKKLG